MNMNFKVASFIGLLSLMALDTATAEKPSKSDFSDWGQAFSLSLKPRAKANPVTLTGLGKLKVKENNHDWESCMRISPEQFRTQKLVRDWVMLTWSHCAEKSMEEHVPDLSEKRIQSSLKPFFELLATLEKNRELLSLGLAHQHILQNMIHVRVNLADWLERADNKYGLSQAQENLNELSEYSTILDKENRAKLLYYQASLAQNSHQLKVAAQFLEESLSEKPSKKAREKLNSVRLALGLARQDDVDLVKSGSAGPVSDAEAKAEARLNQSFEANDLLTYVDDGVSYLHRFPNGRKAKSVLEKILDIYIQIRDRSFAEAESPNPKYGELRERCLALMEGLDPTRLFDWAKLLHRRGDFSGSQHFAVRAWPSLSNSTNSSTLLWVMGRNSEFMGQYAQAQKYFEQFIASSSGHEDLVEVEFRLALVEIRQGQSSSAIANLEKLLLQKNIDRYELVSRYWLIRALQSEKNPRADAEVQQFLSQYPFSYYGIRLRSETTERQVKWPDNFIADVKVDSKVYLNPMQRLKFERIQILSKQGWFNESQREIAEFPGLKDPLQKILLANTWSESQAFPAVIKLVNEAMDQSNDLRSLAVIKLGFPNEFAEAITKEADRNGLSPYLVKSLIRQESAFSTQATSSSNALGLMQLIPPTASEVAQELHLGSLNLPEDIFDASRNIQMGTYYLSRMIKKFYGIVPLGLAAYNAGPQKLQSFLMARPELLPEMSETKSNPYNELWIDELPWSETSFYVKAILRNVLIYKTLDVGVYSLNSVIWSDLAHQ